MKTSRAFELAAQASAHTPEIALSRWHRFAGELIALVYIAMIAEIAHATGAFYVLFPELGALSHDVFTRPRGTWAEAPVLLAITPVITGAIGIFFTRALPYGYLSVLLTVGGAVAVILALKSPIAPCDLGRSPTPRIGSEKLVVPAGHSARHGLAGSTVAALEKPNLGTAPDVGTSNRRHRG